MAITITDRGDYGAANAAGVLSTSAFTPANASVLIAIGYNFDSGTGTPLTFTDSFVDSGGGTWTTIINNDNGLNAFGDTAHVRAWYRVIGTSAGSHTVTAHGTVSPVGDIAFSVLELAGAVNASLISQSVQVSSTVTPIVPTLAVTPATDSLVICGVLDQVSGSATLALPSGYSDIYSAVLGTGDSWRASYKNGSAASSASTAVQAADINQAIMFEISGTPTTPVPGFSLSDTFGGTGGTAWAKAVGVTGDGAEVDIWYRRIGTSPSLGAVTSVAATSSPGREMSVIEVANRNASTPLRAGQIATATVTTASETVQLPAAPLVDSVTVAATISRGDASAPGTPASGISLINTSTGGDGYSSSYQQSNSLQAVVYTGLATTRNLGAMAEFQTQVVAPPPGGGFRLFANNSPWNTTSVPGLTYPWYPACDSRLAGLNYGINNGPNYYAPATHSKPTDPSVTFTIEAGWNNFSQWTYTGPMSGSAIAPAGGDGNLDVIFPNGDLLDLYQVTGSGSTRHAGVGVLTNWQTGSGFAVGPNVGDFAGTTAIACCQAGGSILADDIATGAINHGLRIAFDYADLGGAAGAGPGVGPAAVSGHNDDGGGPGPLAEGMFLMVDGPEPGGLPYWGHQLWVTLATYGAWITDKLSGPPQIFGDGNSAQTDQFGFYSQMPWINTICKRLRATHRGF